MNSVEVTLRQQLAAICADLETKYPGCSEEILGRFFGTLEVPVKKQRAKKTAPLPASPAPEAETKEEKKKEEEKKDVDGRKRVISKKMSESFLALATSLQKENPAADLERAKEAYKTLTDEELQQKGGDFTSFMHVFLTGSAPAPPAPKAPKAKKEKTPTRIERWTPTLTRTLTKIVEENGGKMDDKHKKSFHEWVDALPEDQFASAELAGHMRVWVSTMTGRSNAAPVAVPEDVRTHLQQDEDEEDEDLEEFEHEGESLARGVTSGKIFRSTPAGDVWIGNAGVGRFSAVKTA